MLTLDVEYAGTLGRVYEKGNAGAHLQMLMLGGFTLQRCMLQSNYKERQLSFLKSVPFQRRMNDLDDQVIYGFFSETCFQCLSCITTHGVIPLFVQVFFVLNRLQFVIPLFTICLDTATMWFCARDHFAQIQLSFCAGIISLDTQKVVRQWRENIISENNLDQYSPFVFMRSYTSVSVRSLVLSK